MSALSDLLNSSGFSARQVGEKAEEMGITLPYGTISAYWTDNHPKKPKESTLEGISAVTKIPVPRLRRAAGMSRGEREPWVPPAESNRLSRSQRHALAQLIKSIVDAGDRSEQPQDWQPGWGGVTDDPDDGVPGSKNPGVGGDEHGEHGRYFRGP